MRIKRTISQCSTQGSAKGDEIGLTKHEQYPQGDKKNVYCNKGFESNELVGNELQTGKHKELGYQQI